MDLWCGGGRDPVVSGFKSRSVQTNPSRSIGPGRSHTPFQVSVSTSHDPCTRTPVGQARSWSW